jgi:hypothetical protein
MSQPNTKITYQGLGNLAVRTGGLMPEPVIEHGTYLSVYEFGATGNGVTDDSAAINTAIATCAGTGITLVFTSGTFLCTANAIVNPTGVPLQFGPGVVVTGTNAASLTVTGNVLPYRARLVLTTTTIASYTGSGTGTLTLATGTGIGNADGSAVAVNDVILLPAGVLGSLTVTAKDAGPWVVTALGGASASCILVRPSWWTTGSTMPVMAQFQVGPEGTLFGGTQWSCWATPGTIVGTTDPSMFPDRVITQGSLSTGSGTLVLTSVPIRSASKSVVVPTVAAVSGTNTGAVTVQPLAITAGALGTASVTIQTLATALAVNAVASTATINVLIANR